MNKDKKQPDSKAKSEDGIGGLLLLGGLVGGVIWGAFAYERRQDEKEAQRQRLEAQRREEIARLIDAAEGKLRGEFGEKVEAYEQRLGAMAEELRAATEERDRQARLNAAAAAREARAAEERRDQQYKKREDVRDRKFEAHEGARSRTASDHLAQQTRVSERWLAERDAELTPLREHANYLSDLAQPTRPTQPAGPPPVAIDDDQEMAATYAYLGRIGRADLDG